MSSVIGEIKTKIFNHKLPLAVRFFLYMVIVCFAITCSTTVCSGAMSLVHAASFESHITGECGECKWECESENDGCSLRIFPKEGEQEGRLGASPFPWNKDFFKAHAKRVTKVVIAKTVEAQDCRKMFKDFISMKTIDLSGLKVQGSIDMFHMFKNCRSLKIFSAENWDTTEALHVSDMFSGTTSLQCILIGRKFYFGDTLSPSLETIGSNKETHWMQVNLAKGGTNLFPCGRLFRTFGELVAFHHDLRERTSEREAYVRVTPQLTVLFSAGADDATGHMPFQTIPYDPLSVSAYSKNKFRRVGYAFAGWLDKKGQTIPDEASVINSRFEYRRQIELTAQWRAISHIVSFNANTSDACEYGAALVPLQLLTVGHNGSVSIPRTYRLRCRKRVIETFNTKADGTGQSYRPYETIRNVTKSMVLYAQWVEDGKVSITYVTSDEAGGEVSNGGGVFSASGLKLPDGYHVRAKPHEGYAFLRWTCDLDEKWFSFSLVLTAEDIESVAKESGAFVTAVFTAQFQVEDPYVFFYPNSPDTVPVFRGDPVTCPVKRSVSYGDSLCIRDVPMAFVKDFSPMRQFGYSLAGWNTRVDGTGVPYGPSGVIRNITKSLALYAQWTENKTLLTYTVSDDGSGMVLRDVEEVLVHTGIPLGSTAVPYDGYAFERWVCPTKKGWSYTGKELGGAQIMGAAESDDTLGPISFVAHFVPLVDVQPKTPDASGGPNEFMTLDEFVLPDPADPVESDRDKRLLGANLGVLLFEKPDGWNKVIYKGKESWHYCVNGRPLKGPQRLAGRLSGKMNDFFFDTTTSEQVYGWRSSEEGDKWYYYGGEEGALLKGPHRLKGRLDGKMYDFYFDTTNGIQIHGWKQFPLEQKLCYYSKKDGRMLKGRQMFGKKEYYFDEVTGALH